MAVGDIAAICIAGDPGTEILKGTYQNQGPPLLSTQQVKDAQRAQQTARMQPSQKTTAPETVINTSPAADLAVCDGQISQC